MHKVLVFDMDGTLAPVGRATDSESVELLKELIYVLKENNITNITKCTLNKDEDYFFQANQYINLFNEI